MFLWDGPGKTLKNMVNKQMVKLRNHAKSHPGFAGWTIIKQLLAGGFGLRLLQGCEAHDVDPGRQIGVGLQGLEHREGHIPQIPI